MLVKDLYQNTPKTYPTLNVLYSQNSLSIVMDNGVIFLISDHYCGLMSGGEPLKVTEPLTLHVAKSNFKIDVCLYDIMGIPFNKPRFVLSFTDQPNTKLSGASFTEDGAMYGSDSLRIEYERCKELLMSTRRVAFFLEAAITPAVKTMFTDWDDDSEMHDNEWSESQCEISKLIQKKLHNELLRVKSLNGVVELDATNIDINEKGEYVITIKANRI